MSDYSKEHTNQMPGKGAPSAKPMPGAKQQSGKNHETDISRSEGLDLGSVHPAHTKEQVKMHKENPAPYKASKAQRARVLSGNGNTMGEGSVTNQKTGHGGLASSIQNTKVRNKAFGFNKRSQEGNANPSAFADCGDE